MADVIFNPKFVIVVKVTSTGSAESFLVAAISPYRTKRKTKQWFYRIKEEEAHWQTMELIKVIRSKIPLANAI